MLIDWAQLPTTQQWGHRAYLSLMTATLVVSQGTCVSPADQIHIPGKGFLGFLCAFAFHILVLLPLFLLNTSNPMLLFEKKMILGKKQK